jgi:hypothetical protein
MWQTMFLNVWLFSTILKKFCEFILNLINSWLLESLNRVEKGLAMKPRKRVCYEKNGVKLGMRIMHKLDYYMVYQMPLSKNPSCHSF